MESLVPLVRRTEVVSAVQDGVIINSMAVYEANIRLLNARIAALVPLLSRHKCSGSLVSSIGAVTHTSGPHLSTTAGEPFPHDENAYPST